MRNRYQALVLLLLLCAVAACGGNRDTSTSAALAPTPTPRPALTAPIRILHLDSYHARYLWSQNLRTGLLDGLTDSGLAPDGNTITFETFYMDTKRNTTDLYFARITTLALAHIEDFEPDYLIATDNNAIRLVVQEIQDNDFPIIIAGLNDRPENYGLQQRPNVTGVLERPHFEDTLNWIASVFGDDARITFIADNSASSRPVITELSRVAAQSSTQIVRLVASNSFAEWQATVASAAEDSDVILVATYGTVRNHNGTAMEGPEVMGWITANSRLPVVGLWEFTVREGALGGTVISGTTQGRIAAEKLAALVDGTPASELGFTTPPYGRLILNRTAVARWEVSIPLSLLELSEMVE